MSDATRILDLAAPQFSPEAQAAIDGMSAMAADFPLDVDELKRRACADVGLDDFGNRDYEERLAVLVSAFRDVPRLRPAGAMSFHLQLLALLKNRLLLTDLLTRHPEVLDVEVTAPILIVGLPRTGTTHLHNLLSADPGLRSLPYWESLQPVPLSGEGTIDPDPRIARTESGLQAMDLFMPLFPMMHEMTSTHVHEEIQLLAIDFSTMLFETVADVPAWARYYREHDQTPHYRYMRTVLQAMQYLRGGQRWVLKSPQHLEQLPVLMDTFPDATFVITHRDPTAVTVSLATMVAYSGRMHADPPDVTAISHRWADRVETLLTACLRDRDLLPADKSIDVRFDDFMSDDVGMVRRICHVAGHRLTERGDAAIAAYLAEHKRGRLGRIDYRAEDLGLDLDELNERFAPYVARFLPS
jgi:Sulfotransferase family